MMIATKPFIYRRSRNEQKLGVMEQRPLSLSRMGDPPYIENLKKRAPPASSIVVSDVEASRGCTMPPA